MATLGTMSGNRKRDLKDLGRPDGRPGLPKALIPSLESKNGNNFMATIGW